MLFTKTTRRIQKPRLVQSLGEPIEWVERALYVRVALDKQLTWAVQTNQVGRKTAQRTGLLGPLLNGRSRLSIRNCALLQKQVIRPMVDYTCPLWRSAAQSHVRKL